MSISEMSHLDEEEIHNVSIVTEITQNQQTSPTSLPYKDQECQEFVPTINHIDHEVLLTNQVLFA